MKKNFVSLVVFILFIGTLVAVTFYSRRLNSTAESPVVLDGPPDKPDPPPQVDPSWLSRTDFVPYEYIPYEFERLDNTYTIKCDLINDIPKTFELRLYLSKSYEDLIELDLNKTGLWQLNALNEFERVSPPLPIRLSPSVDEIGLFTGYRHRYDGGPDGHFRLVIEFDCEKELGESEVCVILAVLK